MPLQEMVSASALQSALRGVRRACYAGLDSVTLRREVVRRAAPALPAEAHVLMLTDPDTGLVTHAVGERVPEGLVRDYYAEVYPPEAGRTLDSVRAGHAVTSLDLGERAVPDPVYEPGFGELVHRHGFHSELRGALAADRRLWGSWCSLREQGSPAFAERERRFLHAIAPHLARGLRFAALLGAAGETDEAQPPPAARTPGVLMIDARGRATVRNPAATRQLVDLADVGLEPPKEGTGEGVLPLAVAGLAARLRALLAGDPTLEETDRAAAELPVRGRSGRWYVLRASMMESEGGGTTVVVIDPVAHGEAAPLLTQLYGLSSREREVLAAVARGLPTNEIAARLGISPYAVQDHLAHASEKVGVRGRRALLARLFLDGRAARLAPAGALARA